MRQKIPRQDNRSECRNLLLDERRRTTATLLGGGHDTTLLQGSWVHGMITHRQKMVEKLLPVLFNFLARSRF